MLFVCENEKQGNLIHFGVSVALNFLHLEGQARLRSSGIDAALIWYLIIWIWFLSRINRMALVCENYCWGDAQTRHLMRQDMFWGGCSDESTEIQTWCPSGIFRRVS